MHHLRLHGVKCANTALDVQTTNMALTRLINHAVIQDFSSRGGSKALKNIFPVNLPTFLRGAPNDLDLSAHNQNNTQAFEYR